MSACFDIFFFCNFLFLPRPSIAPLPLAPPSEGARERGVLVREFSVGSAWDTDRVFLQRRSRFFFNVPLRDEKELAQLSNFF